MQRFRLPAGSEISDALRASRLERTRDWKRPKVCALTRFGSRYTSFPDSVKTCFVVEEAATSLLLVPHLQLGGQNHNPNKPPPTKSRSLLHVLVALSLCRCEFASALTRLSLVGLPMVWQQQGPIHHSCTAARFTGFKVAISRLRPCDSSPPG